MSDPTFSDINSKIKCLASEARILACSDINLKTHKKDYICETKPMGGCSLGWQLNNGNCYMINTARSTTWTVAKDSFDAVSATLLKISSDEEQGFLKSTLDPTAS